MTTSLLDLAEDLATDPSTKAAFARDPDGFLAERGLDELTAEDLGTALEHVADSLPPDLATQLPEARPGAEPTEVLDGLVQVQPVDDGDIEFGTGLADDDEPEESEDAEGPEATSVDDGDAPTDAEATYPTPDGSDPDATWVGPDDGAEPPATADDDDGGEADPTFGEGAGTDSRDGFEDLLDG